MHPGVELEVDAGHGRARSDHRRGAAAMGEVANGAGLPKPAEGRVHGDNRVAGHHRDRVRAGRVRVAVRGVGRGVVGRAEGGRAVGVGDVHVQVHRARRRSAVLLAHSALHGAEAVEREVLGHRLDRREGVDDDAARVGVAEVADEVVAVHRDAGSAGRKPQRERACERVAKRLVRVVVLVVGVVAGEADRDRGVPALVVGHDAGQVCVAQVDERIGVGGVAGSGDGQPRRVRRRRVRGEELRRDDVVRADRRADRVSPQGVRGRVLHQQRVVAVVATRVAPVLVVRHLQGGAGERR